MDQITYHYVKVLWDYMHTGDELRRADCIVGFGCYNEEISLRAAELYHQGWAPLVLFSGGLGRNTKQMWTRPEADRFADVAIAQGVPPGKILIENKSTNTAENILFTRKILEQRGIRRIIGVHKPFMERRVAAALGVYWKEADCVMTSPQMTIEEYVQASLRQGIDERAVIEILVGDFQRMDVYARKGYQLPQQIPPEAWSAFRSLTELGYTGQLVK